MQNNGRMKTRGFILYSRAVGGPMSLYIASDTDRIFFKSNNATDLVLLQNKNLILSLSICIFITTHIHTTILLDPDTSFVSALAFTSYTLHTF